jgi:hypothetical protein
MDAVDPCLDAGNTTICEKLRGGMKTAGGTESNRPAFLNCFWYYTKILNPTESIINMYLQIGAINKYLLKELTSLHKIVRLSSQIIHSLHQGSVNGRVLKFYGDRSMKE